ncbi:hypothetical protein HO173_004258 [Letharia columbiana]|uniref:EKC/KEOPS complex subunit CGI121 n=1 Tax=Letharia columbiana TaxID=112416 RepID=A0A8H6FYZ6_9LECA|nr:uncharacterized protein HO173_004258 [Letharia columbiana]KAF6237368.1 hypothetical protein HO173_004258 [Letharia columbiana]
MASLQTLNLAHLPPDLAVHIALYADLQNAPFLRDQLLQGNPDFEYALIDATVILSTTHVLAAVFRAANDHLNGRLRSRTVHSEIVFSLGANNNIAQSLRTFGITATTTNLLAIKLTTNPSITASTVSEHLTASVNGTPVEFSDATLAKMADVGKIRKLYKLSGVGEADSKGKRRRKDGSEEGSGGVDGVKAGSTGYGAERERKELEVAILGLMALRGAV